MDAPAEHQKLTVRQLLREPGMGPLSAAELVSALGSAMVGIAITFFAYRSTGSLLHTIVITAAYTLPAAVLGVPAGKLADHHSRRTLLVWLWGAKALSYVGMAVLSATGTLTSGWLLVTSLVAGSLSALIFPAWEEHEKDLVPAELLDAVNGLFSSIGSLATLVGAIAGAVVVAAVGETVVFVVNALTFVPLMVVTWATRPAEVVHRGEGRQHRFRATLAAVRADEHLVRPLRSIAVLSLLAAPVGQLLPAIADEVHGSADAGALGLVTAIFAGGASLVAVVITTLRDRYDRPALVEVAFATCSGVLVLAGVHGMVMDTRGAMLWGVVALMLALVGLGISVAQSATAAALQANAEPSADVDPGSIFALYGIAYTALAPLGALTLGRLAEGLGLWGTIALIGVGLSAYATYNAVDLRRSRARGSLPPLPTSGHVRMHARPLGWIGALFAHVSLRHPLQPGARAPEPGVGQGPSAG